MHMKKKKRTTQILINWYKKKEEKKKRARIPKQKSGKLREVWSFNLPSGDKLEDREREKEESSFLAYAFSKQKTQIQNNK